MTKSTHYKWTIVALATQYIHGLQPYHFLRVYHDVAYFIETVCCWWYSDRCNVLFRIARGVQHSREYRWILVRGSDPDSIFESPHLQFPGRRSHRHIQQACVVGVVVFHHPSPQLDIHQGFRVQFGGGVQFGVYGGGVLLVFLGGAPPPDPPLAALVTVKK